MYLEMATSITVPFNPVKVQTSRKVDRIGDNTSKAADLGKRIDEEINILLNRQQETIKMIQSLHNADYMRVLFKVYVQFKSLKVTSQEMNKSYSYTIELHKKALAEFETVYADKLGI
ncbi:MAG: hypothetical protein SPJ11_02460 [Coprococcus catus]|nr:hypothetical protein [Coprococcus catus]